MSPIAAVAAAIASTVAVRVANSVSNAFSSEISRSPIGIVSAFKLHGQFEQVAGSRIAVQLGRQGQAHASSRLKVGDLLVRQRLDRPRLQAGIGRLGERRAARGDGEREH